VAKKHFSLLQLFLFKFSTTFFSITNISDKNGSEFPRPRAKLRPCFGIRGKVLHQVLPQVLPQALPQVLHQLNLSQS